MGGFGSGRWHGYKKRVTVEDCLILDIADIADFVISGIMGNGPESGLINCSKDSSTGHRGKIRYSIEIRDDDSQICRLRYRIGVGSSRKFVDIPILLQTSYPNFGGCRWWFSCPLEVDGVPCNRRARTLYLPLDRDYFACRVCHDLTYECCQLNHKFDRLLSIAAW